MTTGFHCCLPRAALVPGDFSDKGFSLVKPCKTCNKLQHVIMLGILGRALLCGVLGGTSALEWSAGHPVFTLYEPPMPPSAHLGYSVTWKHSLSPLLHPEGACYWLSRTRCGEYREKDFSPCLSFGVHMCVYISLSFSEDNKWIHNSMPKLRVTWLLLCHACSPHCGCLEINSSNFHQICSI